MSKLSVAVLAIAAVLAVQPAMAKDLRGDAFITAMNGNTLAGKMSDGKPFNVYFLPGGQSSYQEAGGQPHYGTWKLDKAGDVCVAWAPGGQMASGCFHVAINGDKVTWSNKDGSQGGLLLGGVEPLTMNKIK